LPERKRVTETEITIRPAVANDAAAIHGMIQALAAGLGMAGQVSSSPQDFLLHGFGDRPAFEALIAEQDGQPLGLSLYFSSFSSWAGKRGVYLQDIFVDERARGTGLGKRLLVATARRAAEQGARFMRLAVDKDNQLARDFYRNAGMIHAERDCIYKAWNDAFEALQGDNPGKPDGGPQA
jgi:ribosomal protein S18 acetylase RimI-like enzyme